MMKFKEIEIKIKVDAPNDATHYQVTKNNCRGRNLSYIDFFKKVKDKWFFYTNNNNNDCWHEEYVENPEIELTEISCVKKEIVKVYDWEIESYDILNKRTIIHNREALTEKEAMWFKTKGAKVRRIEGTERDIEK